MAIYQKVFKRVEEKYMLTDKIYDILMKRIESELVENEYPHSKILNIYYDTDSYELAIKSIQKPTYKEKIRIRSYDIPNENSKVFLELKRKCLGVVTKRRIAVKLKTFQKYIAKGKLDNIENLQIYNEIDYAFKKYQLVPKIMVAYDRDSYYLRESEDIRITFDKNLRSRLNDLDLTYGDEGELFFEEDIRIMEIKSCSAIPIWFVKILNELKIYPVSFSKYGEIYKKINSKK
ncbi:MAG: polyphosphate polymerase domain-containing protein [Clostridia bacterium]|nr:polyphosphate polymerase domain-containing protein [Clostridia bacterium]